MIAIITKEDLKIALEAVSEVAIIDPLPETIAVKTGLIIDDDEDTVKQYIN